MFRKMIFIAAVMMATGCSELAHQQTVKTSACCPCCEECSCCKSGMCPMTKEKKDALAAGKDIAKSCCCKKDK